MDPRPRRLAQRVGTPRTSEHPDPGPLAERHDGGVPHVININDLCYFEPVLERCGAGVALLRALYQGKNELCFTIANAQGRENGWCWIHMIWGKLYRIAGSAVSAEVPNDLHVAVHRSPPYIRSPEKSSIDSRPKWYSESIAAG